MEDFLGLGLLALAALVMGIVALAKLSHLGASIEVLKRRLSKLEGRDEIPTREPIATKGAVPPPLPNYVTQQPKVATTSAAVPATVPAKPDHAFNWESILGVKLFAWIGGFAFFLGIVFFVKYAFENNWITPAMRIIAGAIIGTLLIVVSLLPKVRRYRIPAQSVCATGVLILYADTYAAHAFYNLISLTAAMVLMWIVTAIALGLAHYLTTQTIAWLGIVGGFLTPPLFHTTYANSIVLFGYTGVLSCAIAAIGGLKRWNYLLIAAAVGSVLLEFAWAADAFGQSGAAEARIVFLFNQALFLILCVALTWTKLGDNWTLAAAAVAGFAPLFAFIIDPKNNFAAFDCGFATILLSSAGLIAIAVAHRRIEEKSKGLCVIVGLALLLVWSAEWSWFAALFFKSEVNAALSIFVGSRLTVVVAFHVAIFLLFVATPHFVGTKRVWPWFIAAVAGPLQFWFVYQYISARPGFAPGIVADNWLWLPTLGFAIPAAIGVWYLIKKEHVDLASGDARLASQGAAVLAFVSLVFPVQFHREWITLGWAIEGLLLLLLYRWIPNRRLRIVALIVLAGAFVRLALNPAVLEYHKRTQTPISNWYLYAYGIAAICFFLSARWFGEPKEKDYERIGTPLLYSLAGIVLFLLMNIEIADYFSIGPTLTFSFSGNFARDMTYTIAWSLFAFGLLVLGIRESVRAVRLVGIALLLVAFAKLFLHDLDSLEQLYRIGAFLTLAVIAIVASFVYQRFLLPRTKT